MYAVPMYDGDHPRIIRTCISVLLVAVSLVCELFDAKLQKWWEDLQQWWTILD